ncbi:NAD(P)/FAD-dependent oxidoreductase [Helicobacter sp. 11S02596-1]|uniref:phytoene desaturase family protein n=1 Tax=Helicobacter sp. 11S02596-1 TaxID=1476194 RepID=UPI000BA74151|nr:NAD(P)/FAD-dependent oxidoreductase [Helicobacter sp. 11S02596-1]
MNTFDAIVIGSGLGGLSCAATLSKAGKKVLVLEQHSLIGGCATCFERKGMKVDAGLHELDWGNPKTDMKHLIFKKLGLDKKIQIVKLPSVWTIKTQKETLTIPHGIENVKSVLKAKFPNEAKGIDTYFRKIKFQAFLARRFPWDMGWVEFFFAPLSTLVFFLKNMITNDSVGKVLDSCIHDDRLKKILNANISYYHHDPYAFIWSFHAVPQKHYYDEGVYIKGGSQSLSDALTQIITEAGGQVRANCEVSAILTQDQTAVGVVYRDKKTHQQISLKASKIIANCDPAIVYSSLLDSYIDTRADTEITKDFSITTSLVSAYLIFDKNLSVLYPDMDYNTFIYDEAMLTSSFKDTKISDAPIEKRPLAFINYSKIDNGLSDSDDRYLAVVAVYSYFEEWDNLEKAEYREKKRQLLEAIQARLEEMFAGINNHCIHAELATPKTIARYIKTRKGTPYGYDQDIEGFIGRERFKSKSVKNLYFASAFGAPGGGFTGAILAGYRTAHKILDPYMYPKRIGVIVLVCVVIGWVIGILMGS